MEKIKIIKTVIAIILIALILLVGITAAAYLMTSNTIVINVGNQATLTLTSNSTSPTLSEAITLTATCSDTSFNGQVAFTANSASIGSSTAVAGVASLVWAPSQAISYNVIASASHP